MITKPKPKDKKGYITKWDAETEQWIYEIRYTEMTR